MAGVPELLDVVPDFPVLTGAKVGIREIEGVPLLFTNWDIAPSKFKDNGRDTLRLTLQFDWNGKQRIVFTGSCVLISQIRAFESVRGRTPFRAMIKQINHYYKFCRAEEI